MWPTFLVCAAALGPASHFPFDRPSEEGSDSLSLPCLRQQCGNDGRAWARAQTPSRISSELQYVGPQGADAWAVRFRLTRATLQDGDREGGYTLRGATTSGKQTLTLESTFDRRDELRASRVSLQSEEQVRVATVEVAKGRARVLRRGQDPQEFDVPAGVIVTSAPDWTDVVLLCQRYNRAKGGKQTFAALWIHPVQSAQLLELTIERKGRLAIQGGTLELTEFLVHLRNQSPYRAWATTDGTLIRLAPLAAKGARAGLFRKGYEDDPGWKAAR